jgi:hypothetical protein
MPVARFPPALVRFIKNRAAAPQAFTLDLLLIVSLKVAVKFTCVFSEKSYTHLGFYFYKDFVI